MKVFFDTSAFVKRYVSEQGSEKVFDICRQADSLVLSVICLPEMISTLKRLVREGVISVEQYSQTRDVILSDLKDVEICNLSPEVISLTIKCLEDNSLRAMDALHIGCALSIKPDLFISSDQQQIAAAKREGLKIMEI